MFLLLIVDSDDNIISEVYFKNYNQMLYMANRILGLDNGEDAVQDVFIKLIEIFDGKIAELRDKSIAYFVISVKNHSLDTLKKNRRIVYVDPEIEEIFINMETPEDVLMEKDDKERLIQLLSTLTPVMQETL